MKNRKVRQEDSQKTEKGITRSRYAGLAFKPFADLHFYEKSLDAVTTTDKNLSTRLSLPPLPSLSAWRVRNYSLGSVRARAFVLI